MAAGKITLIEYIGGAARSVAYWSSDGTDRGELSPYYGQDSGASAAVAPGNVTVMGRQIGLGIDAATALTIPPGAVFAWIQAEGQDARWRDDGATNPPTTTSGMRVMKDCPPEVFPAAMLANAKFIGAAAGCKLNVTYAG